MFIFIGLFARISASFCKVLISPDSLPKQSMSTTPRLSRRETPPMAEGFCAGGGDGNGHFQYEIGTAAQCHFGAQVFGDQGGSASLDIVTAHGDNDIVCSQFFFGVLDLIFVSSVKGIVFGDDSGSFHKFWWMLLSEIVRFRQFFGV